MSDISIRPVAVVHGMCNGEPVIEVFSDPAMAMEHCEALSQHSEVNLIIKVRYIDYIPAFTGEA